MLQLKMVLLVNAISVACGQMQAMSIDFGKKRTTDGCEKNVKIK